MTYQHPRPLPKGTKLPRLVKLPADLSKLTGTQIERLAERLGDVDGAYTQLLIQAGYGEHTGNRIRDLANITRDPLLVASVEAEDRRFALGAEMRHRKAYHGSIQRIRKSKAPWMQP